ncbi:MAG: radical SAM protein [bacterium]|nr:radical SAM protein [bacterium]
MTYQNDAETYVVSPFLNSVPREIVESFTRYVQGDPDAYESIFGNRSGADIALVLDMERRQRLYIMSREEQRLLDRIRVEPGAVKELEKTRSDTIRGFIRASLLMKKEEVYRLHRYVRFEIEINRHCNYRCRFCPISTDPKPRAFMSDETFNLVLDRVKEYGGKSISLNHYSEPSLDPNLVSKITSAARRDLKVKLNTNASLLNRQKIEQIASLGNTEVMINLPDVDKEGYERATGSKLYDRAIENIQLLHQNKVPVTLAINAPFESREATTAKINSMFSGMDWKFAPWPTDDRAGVLDNKEYALPVNHSGLLNGCTLFLSALNVSWEGKVFLCCQDFHQDYILGDLREQGFEEISNSPQMIKMREWIMGWELPPDDFICNRCDWTRSVGTGEGTLSVGNSMKFLQSLGAMEILGMMMQFPRTSL